MTQHSTIIIQRLPDCDDFYVSIHRSGTKPVRGVRSPSVTYDLLRGAGNSHRQTLRQMDTAPVRAS